MKRHMILLLFFILTVNMTACKKTNLDITMSVYYAGQYESLIGDDRFEPSNSKGDMPRFKQQDNPFQVRSYEDLVEYSNLNYVVTEGLYPEGFFHSYSLIVIPLTLDRTPEITLEQYKLEEEDLSLEFHKTDWLYVTNDSFGPSDYYIVLEINTTKQLDISYTMYDRSNIIHVHDNLVSYYPGATYLQVYTSYEAFQSDFPENTTYTEKTFLESDMLYYHAPHTNPGYYRTLFDLYIQEYRYNYDVTDGSYDTGNMMHVEFLLNQINGITPAASVEAHDFILVPKGSFDSINNITISIRDENGTISKSYDYPIIDE